MAICNKIFEVQIFMHKYTGNNFKTLLVKYCVNKVSVIFSMYIPQNILKIF